MAHAKALIIALIIAGVFILLAVSIIEVTRTPKWQKVQAPATSVEIMEHYYEQEADSDVQYNKEHLQHFLDRLAK